MVSYQFNIADQAMSRYSRKNSGTDKTKEDAIKIARSTQRPGQTKEQTRLIAQGIQKGIEQYKKQQSSKARELDKRLKKASDISSPGDTDTESSPRTDITKNCKLPWMLLIFSWTGFAVVALMLFIQ